MFDFKKLEEVLQTLSTFNVKQWVSVIIVVTCSVTFAFWVENRYAKIKEVEQRLQKSQQQLDAAHFLSLELFSLLSEEQRKIILEKLELTKKDTK